MTDFMLVALDQVINQAPRLRYMSGGQVKVPLVLKAGYGFIAGWAGQYSNCYYNLFLGVPGLRVAIPSTPYDAKGLMKAAIRDDNPVVYLHHWNLTLIQGEVPEEDYVVPFRVADVKREGTDVTVVATGWMVHRSLSAAEQLAREGISVEVVDPRTLAPLDIQTTLNSVKKTSAAGACRSGAEIRIGVLDHRGSCRGGGGPFPQGSDQAGNRTRGDDPLQQAHGRVRDPQ